MGNFSCLENFKSHEKSVNGMWQITERKKQTVCGDTGNKVQAVQDFGPLCFAFFSNLCWKQLSLEKYEKYTYCKEPSKGGSRFSMT